MSFHGQQSLEPRYAVPVPQVMPFRYGEGPGEYETQYRPDIQACSEDKKIPSGTSRPAELPRQGLPNYKPGPLRWPFLCALMLALLGLIAATAWACNALPVEDSRQALPTTVVRSTSSIVTPASSSPPLVRFRGEELSTGSPTASSTGAMPPDKVGQDGSVTISSLPTQTKSNYGKDGTVTLSAGTPSNYGHDGAVTLTTYTTAPSNYGKDGTVTATPAPTNYAELGPTTINGVATTVAPTYVNPQVTTLTDASGAPIATLASTPSALSTPTAVILTDANGIPTATVSTSALAAPIVTVLTNSAGVPTATATLYAALPTIPAVATQVFYISKLEYFAGFFLPPIVCVLLTILVRMIDLSAKNIQPFHELTHPLGASAHESLTLETGGLSGMITGVRSLFGGHPLVFLTTLLTLCSVVLVPLAADAVGVNVHGACSETDFNGCAMTLAVFRQPARATMALLAFMVLVVVFLLFFLARWRSGVAANPWSIAGIASLTTNPDVRAVLAALPTGRDGRVTNRQLAAALEGRTFKLDYFFGRHGEAAYGIVIADEAGRGLRGSASAQLPDVHADVGPGGGGADDAAAAAEKETKTARHLPFLMLTYTWRLAFLLLLTGLLALILYYNNTGGDTAFERFMDTQGFGVRFLFTLAGVAVSFFWSSFFASVAAVSPYHLLSRPPPSHSGRAGLAARDSVLPAPPLHAVAGIAGAVRRRHGFLAVVAAVAVLAEFVPVLLNNVPMRVTQTWLAHLVCTWLAVGVLCVMWLVVVASFFVAWPHMPVDPGTVAGCMYYVCDSWMLDCFEGLSTLGKRERDWRVSEMGLRYEYGDIQGVSGRRRYGVDSVRAFL